MQLGSPFEIRTTQTLAPAAVGGTIADGTWVATAGKIWGSSSPENTKFGTAGSSTMKLAGTSVETITTGATSLKVTRRSGTWTVDPNAKTISFNATCTTSESDAGANELANAKYSVEAGSTLHLYIDGAAGSSAVLEFTYTKQ